MKDRIILHCDLNNFFASVSLLSNPTLYDMPVAVCGSVEQRHGIVLAKNEIAKKFGVKTAEAVWEAKQKCPSLVTLPPDYKKYNEYSLAAREIYNRYTDLVEPFGIDECWLDVTGSTLLFGSGEQIADRIRRDIKRELGITISVGVSFNKVFAKLGSDMKKPDAVTVISRENYKEKVWCLPVTDLLFVGKSTAGKLAQNGIFTVGDVTKCDDNMLTRLLGKNGAQLKQYALGEDNSPVTPPSENDTPKSIGRTITPPKDITTGDEVWKIYIGIAEEISEILHQKGLFAATIQVHTRDTALKTKEYSYTMPCPLNTSILIAREAMKLFRKSYNWQLPLRSVGFRVTNLKSDNVAFQQDLFGTDDQNHRQEIIEDSILNVRKKFGTDSLTRATIYEKKDKNN
ncbi:MAG: DNA polymerase IV [Clostridia bacterium]|nr:DNA polymerase IV [Clostridia bacterium]